VANGYPEPQATHKRKSASNWRPDEMGGMRGRKKSGQSSGSEIVTPPGKNLREQST